MRQTLILNLVVLGFFVFLFRSIYRKRQSPHLSMWIIAYIFAMAHFAVQLWQPHSAVLQSVMQAASFLALLLCGLWILLSHPALKAPANRQQVILLLGGSFVLLTLAVIPQSPPNWLIAASAGLCHLAAGYLLWRFGRQQPVRALLCIAASAACYTGVVIDLYRGGGDAVPTIFLMELYGFCCVVVAHAFRRRSAGAWTTILGLALWTAVFPTGFFFSIRHPHVVFDPEIWNVPKVLVAFGMLVILFEDEVAIARRDREHYRHLFDTNPTPMWIFDKDSTQLLEANSAAVRTFGWKRSDLSGLTIRDLVAASERPGGQLLDLNRKLSAGSRREHFPAAGLENEVRAATMRFQTRRGEELTVEATLQRAKFLGEEARLLMAKDVTAQVQMHEQLVHMANHDALTGLPNRFLLSDRLEAALAAAVRHGTQAAVLCLDLDRFKQINDTYGHAVGDSCLSEVARRLKSRLRAVDTAARTGGEEFVVVLNEVRSRADAEAVAHELLQSLSTPHRIGEISVELSASIGIALYPDHGVESSELWNRADAAMYHAKQNGGNRHALYFLAG